MNWRWLKERKPVTGVKRTGGPPAQHELLLPLDSAAYLESLRMEG